MAETIETGNMTHKEYASKGKGDAALTTGIIGTSLAGLLTLGAVGMGGRNGLFGCNASCANTANVTNQDLYIERKECQDYLELTKEYYQGRLINQRELSDAFFAAYQRDTDNSFSLYKNQRDMNDALNQKITDASFGLYKNQRDEKDELVAKINEVEKKVDVMAAIRPYQDALINAKIDNNALMSDYALAKRTCRMIQGELVLPSTPVVTGYGSYSGCNCTPSTTATN